ncbi:cytochrome P450 [Mycena olivaceomarginata]|nr:cytochrome P450 [Mycena olivaceomarginata]
MMAMRSTTISALGIFFNPKSTPSRAMISTIILFAATCLALTLLRRISRQNSGSPFVGGHLILGSTEYFTKRDEFLEEKFCQLNTSIFRFRILFYPVVALRGKGASSMFFNSKSLSFEAGYRLMHGMAPEPHDVNLKEYSELASPTMAKRVSTMLKTDYYERMLPQMLRIVEETFDSHTSASFDPFDVLKPSVVRVILNLLISERMAEEPGNVSAMTSIIAQLSSGGSMLSIVLPWLPTPGRLKKINAVKNLYFLVSKLVAQRKLEEHPKADILQHLLDEGDSMTNIISCLTLFVFASFVETPPTLAWVMIYLSTSPEWKRRAQEEVDAFLAQHCPVRRGTSSLSQYLAQAPLEAWETELPVLDAILDETIRLTLTGALIRRNTGNDFVFEGNNIIRNGDFLTYPLSDQHLNPEHFPNPHEFNPLHHLGVDTTGKFWGFGGGRHPCAGKRSAYIIGKAYIVSLVTGYEYTVKDAQGNVFLTPPAPRKNSFHTCGLEDGVSSRVHLKPRGLC